jgi:citronellol/citronellal dehydrogenase
MSGFAVPADPAPFRSGLFSGSAVLVAPALDVRAGAVAGRLAGLGARVMAGVPAAAGGSGSDAGALGAGPASGAGLPGAGAAAAQPGGAGGSIVVEVADPRQPGQADDLLARAWARFGTLDTLVCSGLGEPRPERAAAAIAVADWKDAIDGELNAVWFLMHAAARQWRDRGQAGSIVCLVNPYREAVAGAAPQRAAGAAVAHLAKTVAVEWAPFRIRVNCVAPAAAAVPRRVADAVAWLSAPSGKFVTGEVVSVGALAAGATR